MEIFNKKALTPFVSILLFASLLLANMNSLTSAVIIPGPIYLHGPPSNPIHVHSNITLEPIHMHSLQGFIYLPQPICTWWRELSPNYPKEWHLTSWVDNDYDLNLSPNDQIDMNYTRPDGLIQTEWYHVDRITVTIMLSGPYKVPWFEPSEPTMAIELKFPSYNPEIIFYPLGSLWHEVWPVYSNIYNLSSWLELLPNGVLDRCDSIDLTDMKTGDLTFWHVEDVATDLILRWKMMDPRCTWWHELYPQYSNSYHLTSWEDYWYPYERISSGDQIDMDRVLTQRDWDIFWSMGDVNRDGYINQTDFDIIVANFGLPVPPADPRADINSDGWVDLFDQMQCAMHFGEDIWTYFDIGKHWYFVDRVTITINVTDWRGNWMMLELKTYSHDEMYYYLKHPVGSLWHSVHPIYSYNYEIYYWDPMDWEFDNCNGVLDPCDYIVLLDLTSRVYEIYHIEDMTYDLILNKKITDPVCTEWHALYPEWEYCNWYHIYNWVDNDDGLLSPCDYVEMRHIPDGPARWYHVDCVNITIKLSYWGEPYIMYLEAMLPLEYMYFAKIMPWEFLWHEIYPYFSNKYYVGAWEDNCNGVLDYCDNVTLYTEYGDYYGYFHVEEVAVDIAVTGPLTVHDVAVTDVAPRRIRPAYRGLDFKVNVTVQNQGNFNETFDVTVYVNLTLIGNQSVTLTVGETRLLIFTWRVPSNFTKGNYILKAEASIVPGEFDTLDNTKVDGIITVTVLDFTGDGKCNLSDLVRIAGRFGAEIGDPHPPPYYDPMYDLNYDGKINLSDLVICAGFFGTTDP